MLDISWKAIRYCVWTLQLLKHLKNNNNKTLLECIQHALDTFQDQQINIKSEAARKNMAITIHDHVDDYIREVVDEMWEYDEV